MFELKLESCLLPFSLLQYINAYIYRKNKSKTFVKVRNKIASIYHFLKVFEAERELIIIIIICVIHCSRMLYKGYNINTQLFWHCSRIFTVLLIMHVYLERVLCLVPSGAGVHRGLITSALKFAKCQPARFANNPQTKSVEAANLFTTAPDLIRN